VTEKDIKSNQFTATPLKTRDVAESGSAEMDSALFPGERTAGFQATKSRSGSSELLPQIKMVSLGGSFVEK